MCYVTPNIRSRRNKNLLWTDFCRSGAPSQICSDEDPLFAADVEAEFHALPNVQYLHTFPFKRRLNLLFDSAIKEISYNAGFGLRSVFFDNSASRCLCVSRTSDHLR